MSPMSLHEQVTGLGDGSQRICNQKDEEYNCDLARIMPQIRQEIVRSFGELLRYPPR